MPEGKALPAGIDSVSITGLGFDATEGGAIEDIVLRKGQTEIVRVARVRPDRGGVGVRADKITFALPEPPKSDAVPPAPVI